MVFPLLDCLKTQYFGEKKTPQKELRLQQVCLKVGGTMYYRTRASTNRARLLTALVYKPRDLLHKIHLLTALKTLDMRYKQRLVDARVRYVKVSTKSQI